MLLLNYSYLQMIIDYKIIDYMLKYAVTQM